MKRACKNIFIKWGIGVIGILTCMGVLWNVHGIVKAEGTENGRVLFISSYSYAWDTVQIQIEGIKAGMEDGVVLDYEFMDTKRVDDETAYRLFYEGLAYRMSCVEPYDVVILGDDAALRFALEYRTELFDGIPLIFEGVNDETLALEAAKDPLVTGVLEKLSVQKNIELGKAIYPDADKVVAILDDSVTGQAERNNFYQHAALFPELTFTEINTSELSTQELKDTLAAVEKDTILIYVVMTEDASGKQYTNRESVKLIAEYASVPALRMVEGGIGWGLLGGNIVSMERSGQLAAQMAMDIIYGRQDSSEIGVVVESPNIYCIDDTVRKKFDISKSVMPKDTVYVNYELRFIERNFEALIPGAIICFLLLGIVVVMCVDNFRTRKLMQELEKTRCKLEKASIYDFLTGLPNRFKFIIDIQEVEKTGDPYSLMMLDIDNFKGINDAFGHVCGDEALKQIADRLATMESEELIPYRLAGDEFILYLASDDPGRVEETAKACLAVFQMPYVLADKELDIHCSIGIATYPEDAGDSKALLVCADDAMYSAKNSGKNAYAFYKDIKNA